MCYFCITKTHNYEHSIYSTQADIFPPEHRTH